MPVGLAQSRKFINAATLSGDLYWAGRLTLATSPAEIRMFDDVYFGRLNFASSTLARENADRDTESVPIGSPAGATEGELGSGHRRRVPGDGDRLATADTTPSDSAGEVTFPTSLKNYVDRPFEELSNSDLDQLTRVLRPLVGNPLISQPRRRPSRQGDSIDMKRTVLQTLKHGGEVMLPARQERLRQPVNLTFVLDVSGSMAARTRALLLCAALFVRSSRLNTAYTVGTELTNVTSALRNPDKLEDALDEAAAVMTGRHGGTLMGECLRELLETSGQSRSIRGAIVIIYSDGLERGDPMLLGEQMRRLSLRTRRVIWMNPLSYIAGYEPLARGMQQALPYVDHFSSGHNMRTFIGTITSTLRNLDVSIRSDELASV